MTGKQVENPASLHDALIRAQRLLAARERTEKELVSRLEGIGFERDTAQEAVEKLKQSGLQSDNRFADCFIRSKLSSGWGRTLIERELEQRGVDISLVPGWPDDYLEDDEYERAMCVLDRSHIHAKDVRAAAYRKLMSKGFGQDISYRASRDFSTQR